MKETRREYTSQTLDEAGADPDPIAQFRRWFEDAVARQVVDANAMSLATASPSGEPAVRTVLLKAVDENGFVFFTNYDSSKARDLAANPRASLLFFWPGLERQVRITGPVSRVSRTVSEDYFGSRPIDSQLAAWASPQSAEVADRQVLEREVEAIKTRFAGGPIPCPPHWGGFTVSPERIEFWQGRVGRLHDRLLYVRQADGRWQRVRLAP